jgi:hypothetical protein
MKEYIGVFIAGIVYLAILYALVRPSSNGPTIVNTVLGTFADLVRGVAGQTFDASTGQWSS